MSRPPILVPSAPHTDWTPTQLGELLVYLACELSDLMHPVVSYSRAGQIELRESGARPERLDQSLARIGAAGRQVLNLLNQMLELSSVQMEQTGDDMDIDDVRAIALEAAGEFAQTAKDKDVSVVIEQPRRAPLAWCDSDRVAQLMRNLIGSAIEFSPAGKSVYVAFGEGELPCSARHAGRQCVPALKVSVLDEGVSVPEHQLLKLFDSPLRAFTTQRGAGAGVLGLLICRAIVRQHGGSIWAQNPLQGGLEVHVLLPREDMRRACAAD
jgi:signal transduction histidine kinase